MKLRPNPSDLQFNLLLMNSAPIEPPADRNEELVHTLVRTVAQRGERERLSKRERRSE